MILLGYDIQRQATLAQYQGVTIALDDRRNPRAKEIFDGLLPIMQDLPKIKESGYQEGDVEVAVVIQSPWTDAVPYSDQAWSDLLSIQRREMTLNKLVAIFTSDDLNPNDELVFHVDMDAHTDEHVIDDVYEGANGVSIYLRGK